MKKTAVVLLKTIMVYLYTAQIGVTWGGNISDVDRLMAERLNTYNNNIRPVINQSESLNITTSFNILAIQDFDEVEENFAVTGLLSLSWFNEHTVWNPADYGGVTNIVVPAGELWTPLAILANPANEVIYSDTEHFKIRLFYNGKNIYEPGALFEAKCSVTTTYYPWDTHNCYLIFASGAYNKEEIHFVSSHDRVFTDLYQPHGEWTLHSTSAYAESWDSVSVINFVFTIKRKPTYYVVNILIPVKLMVLLNHTVFILPVESGERISFCLTVLLSLAVFLTLVGDNLPKTSSSMAIICYYLLVDVSISVLICLMTILNMRLYFLEGEARVPSMCSKIVRLCCCPRLKRKHKRKRLRKLEAKMESDDRKSAHEFMAGHIGVNKGYENDSDRRRDAEGPDNLTGDCETHIGDRAKPGNEADEENHDVTWRAVSVAVDRVLLVVFTAILCSSTAAFVIICASNEEWNS